VNPAVAGGAVALAVDEAAMGLDLDLQDGGVVAAREGSERLTAALTAALVVRQVADLLGGQQVGVIATAVALGPALLATGSAGCCRLAASCGRGGVRRRGVVGKLDQRVGRGAIGGQAVGGVGGLGTAAEEAMAEVAVFGLEEGDLLLKLLFALASALVHGLVEVGLLSEGDGFEKVRAELTGRVTGREGGWGRRGLAGAG